MSSWEQRMSQRAKARARAEVETRVRERFGVFAQWVTDHDYELMHDPENIIPEIIAARCLGIDYGDPGPKLPESDCHACWGERLVWYGNTWGMRHVEPAPISGSGIYRCGHDCHEGEILLAAGA